MFSYIKITLFNKALVTKVVYRFRHVQCFLSKNYIHHEVGGCAENLAQINIITPFVILLFFTLKIYIKFFLRLNCPAFFNNPVASLLQLTEERR